MILLYQVSISALMCEGALGQIYLISEWWKKTSVIRHECCYVIQTNKKIYTSSLPKKSQEKRKGEKNTTTSMTDFINVPLFYIFSWNYSFLFSSFYFYTHSPEDGHLASHNRLLLSQVSPACFLYLWIGNGLKAPVWWRSQGQLPD